MKIAVLGSAPSVARAPFKDAAFAAWTQGKVDSQPLPPDAVPGDFDIWGCSPGCWAVSPRFTRFFELHRWELNVPWFSPEYRQFLRDFEGPVYTGGRIPEIKNCVVYPIDEMEEKFSSYFFTSSLALMMALAIDTIEKIRLARKDTSTLPEGVKSDELTKPDTDDIIGLWGVDMAASDEYSYQRPGCQFFVLEAMRRGIGVYLPPESDLMRPMPVYGLSEWDHNYIKLTEKARLLNQKSQEAVAATQSANLSAAALQGELHALNYFVSTWTSPYGMMPGLVMRQAEGTGLGSGITQLDGRPISRMNVAPLALVPKPVIEAMATQPADTTVETGT